MTRSAHSDPKQLHPDSPRRHAACSPIRSNSIRIPQEDTRRAPLSRLPQGEAHGTREHHTPDDNISYPDMLSGSLTRVSKPCYVIPTACHSPCSAALQWCVRTSLPWIPKNSPQSQIALVIKKLSKHQNLTQFWLELIARVLNMLIGLKGDNYYSKVFKRVNYKLSVITFWVVINVSSRFDPFHMEHEMIS